MVCDRCKASVVKLLQKNNATILTVQLGKVQAKTSADFNLENFKKNLKENGFELIENPDSQLVENIKIKLLELLNNPTEIKQTSNYLSNQLNKEYSLLSKTFKKIEEETIEQYFIKLRIEKVKELIQMQELSFSEISHQLGYNSISHLSGQFKSITGMTMSEYKDSQNWNRKPYDKIL